MILHRVLTAYALRNEAVGYVQGMNYLAAFLLLVTGDETKTFWLFATLVEDVLPGYFGRRLGGFQTDAAVLLLLLQRELPAMCNAMSATCIPVDFVIPRWYLCLFYNTFHPYQVARVWDTLFFAPAAGKATIMQVAMATMALKESRVLAAAAQDDVGVLSTILQDTDDCREHFSEILQRAHGQYSVLSLEELDKMRAQAHRELQQRQARRKHYLKTNRRLSQSVAAREAAKMAAAYAAAARVVGGGGRGGTESGTAVNDDGDNNDESENNSGGEHTSNTSSGTSSINDSNVFFDARSGTGPARDATPAATTITTTTTSDSTTTATTTSTTAAVTTTTDINVAARDADGSVVAESLADTPTAVVGVGATTAAQDEVAVREEVTALLPPNAASTTPTRSSRTASGISVVAEARPSRPPSLMMNQHVASIVAAAAKGLAMMHSPAPGSVALLSNSGGASAGVGGSSSSSSSSSSAVGIRGRQNSRSGGGGGGQGVQAGQGGGRHTRAASVGGGLRSVFESIKAACSGSGGGSSGESEATATATPQKSGARTSFCFDSGEVVCCDADAQLGIPVGEIVRGDCSPLGIEVRY